MLSLFPIVVVMISNVLYHVGQKSLGTSQTPWGPLVVAYGVAFATTAALWLATGASWVSDQPRRALASAFGVGFAVVGIEAGFFFAYKIGWPLSTTATLAHTSVGLVLAVIGVALFGEQLTPSKYVGLAMALVGLIVLTR